MHGLQGNTNGDLDALNQFYEVLESSVNLLRNEKGTGKDCQGNWASKIDQIEDERLSK